LRLFGNSFPFSFHALMPALLAARPVTARDRFVVVGHGLAVQDDAWTFGTARMTDPAIGEDGKLGGCKDDSGSPVFALRSGAPLLAGS
jgi:hypothetical protein